MLLLNENTAVLDYLILFWISVMLRQKRMLRVPTEGSASSSDHPGHLLLCTGGTSSASQRSVKLLADETRRALGNKQLLRMRIVTATVQRMRSNNWFAVPAQTFNCPCINNKAKATKLCCHDWLAAIRDSTILFRLLAVCLTLLSVAQVTHNPMTINCKGRGRKR